MIGYILFLVGNLLLTFIGNGIYAYYSHVFTIWYAFYSVIINFIIIFALDALIAFIIHKLPEKYFNPNLKIYQVSKKEKKIIIKLGIRKWKDKVPDMGQLCDFKKGKVESKEIVYLYKFLVEMCYAETIHVGMILIGFLDLIIWPRLSISIPLVLINFCLNFPPILIQRYNRPRMNDMYNHQLKVKNANLG